MKFQKRCEHRMEFIEGAFYHVQFSPEQAFLLSSLLMKFTHSEVKLEAALNRKLCDTSESWGKWVNVKDLVSTWRPWRNFDTW